MHIIAEAMQIPSKIAGTDFLSLILLKTAISEPVHAPVHGRGIPTNSIRNINSPFSILSLLFNDLFSR